MEEEKTYRIGEVARLLNLETYVLRFWETEFPQIEPLRSDKGQRRYTGDNIAIIKRIQQLLHEQGLTLEGARRVLDGRASVEEIFAEKIVADPEFVRMLMRELGSIRKLLTTPNDQ